MGKHNRSMSELPDAPLPYVPHNTSRTLGTDMAAAGVAKRAPGGKVDFYSLRTCYVSLVLESGASVKEAQVLARHSTPDLTMNVYGRARIDRLAELAETVGEAVLSVEDDAESIESAEKQMLKKAAGAESLCVPMTYGPEKVVEAGGIEPPSRSVSTRASTHIVHLLLFRSARLR